MTSTKHELAVSSQEQAIAAAHGEMTIKAVVDRKRKIVEVMQSVMREGEHFGRIPGCGDKPTLLKAGAEILAMTFGLAPTFRIERTDLPSGHREYQVLCTLTHIASGKVVSEGVGCATTMESKHRWRGGARVCPECGQSTIIRGKAEYGGGWLCFARRGGCGSKWRDGDKAIEGQPTEKIENPDPADQYNTVLKMAKKRAQVDCTLTACGASDMLSQDLEDLPADDAEFVDRPDRSSSQHRATRQSEDAGEIDIEGILAAIADCDTEADLKRVGRGIPYGRMDAATRARVGKCYDERLAKARGQKP
jgi:hypothetical protein